MRTYTVIAEGEFIGRGYPGTMTENSAGQYVLYDGTSRIDALRTHEIAKSYFEDVNTFSGKRDMALMVRAN